MRGWAIKAKGGRADCSQPPSSPAGLCKGSSTVSEGGREPQAPARRAATRCPKAGEGKAACRISSQEDPVRADMGELPTSVNTAEQ